MSIKFYRDEHQDERLAPLEKLMIPECDIYKFVNKITELVQVPPVSVYVKDKLGRSSGVYYEGNTAKVKTWEVKKDGTVEYSYKVGGVNTYSSEPSAKIHLKRPSGLCVFTIVHEIAHHLDAYFNGSYSLGYYFDKNGKRRRKYRKAHTKALLRYMIKLKNILEKKKYFGMLVGTCSETRTRAVEKTSTLLPATETQINEYELEIMKMIGTHVYKSVLAKELVKFVGGNYQKMGATLRGLEKKGFVERDYDERSHLHFWRLTEKGRGRLEMKGRSE